MNARFFLVLAAVSLSFAAELAAATNVTGTISFLTKRGQNPTIAETLVWLEPMSGTRAPRRAPATFQMLTRSKMLAPHVLAIPAGSIVAFPNDDPISHNLFSLSSGNTFDLGLYRKGAGKSEKFESAGIVNVYCNVHPNMSAVIHVMATPYYVFADGNGRFVLPDIPAGRYRLLAWNEQGGAAQSQIDVDAQGRISGSADMTIDGRNRRDGAHANKLGKPYQSPSSRDY
jgi:plastocyanin